MEVIQDLEEFNNEEKLKKDEEKGIVDKTPKPGYKF